MEALKPSFIKLMAPFFLTVSTFTSTSLNTTLPQEIAKAKIIVAIGATTAHLAIGPQNPILKLVVLFIFWTIVSWVVYFILSLLSYVMRSIPFLRRFSA